jgi:hypothetical protein
METEIKRIIFNKKHLIDDKNKDTNKNKKRVETENWTFTANDFAYETQLKSINTIIDKEYKFSDNYTKIILQQINKKIYGYKHQDILKKLLNNEKFITLESIINKMIECELKCYYCATEMSVLYDISREMKQWTVDRIDNDLGHNIDNYYLACLECNLKRRRRSDEKFLFTKQMKLVKIDR